MPNTRSTTPPQSRVNKSRLLSGLIDRAAAGTPTSDGYRLEFSAEDRDIVGVIAACIDAERRSCPYLRFTMTVAPERGRIELEVTGPAGTRRFFDALIEFAS